MRPIVSPTIRSATDTDGPALARLIATVFAEYPGCLFLDEEFPELAGPASHYRSQGGELWIAERDGVVVGSLAVVATGAGQPAELFKVYVAAEARGTGLAQRLFDEAMTFAREHSAAGLILWTDTRFARGHGFYEKLGFRREPVTRYLADASESWEFCYRRQPA